MRKLIIIPVLLFSLLFFCSGDADKEKTSEVPRTVSDQTDTTDIESIDFSGFSIEEFIDTVKNEPERIAAKFLKASVKDGDYKTAAELLCWGNRDIIEKDSLMDYIAFGKSNPEWDDLTALRYSVTRRYIPVLAHFNDIPFMKTVSCDSICRIEYNVTGPLFIKKIFDLSLGENGKSIFDRVMDSSLTLNAKKEFYNHAFSRLELIADSLKFDRRKTTDTLVLIREEGTWKVCKVAKTSFDIFRQ